MSNHNPKTCEKCGLEKTFAFDAAGTKHWYCPVHNMKSEGTEPVDTCPNCKQKMTVSTGDEGTSCYVCWGCEGKESGLEFLKKELQLLQGMSTPEKYIECVVNHLCFVLSRDDEKLREEARAFVVKNYGPVEQKPQPPQETVGSVEKKACECVNGWFPDGYCYGCENIGNHHDGTPSNIEINHATACARRCLKGCPAGPKPPYTHGIKEKGWGGEQQEIEGWEKSFIEKGADIEHERWSKWMRHLFNISNKNPNGEVVILPHLVERWQRQAATPYADLSEEDKEKDRVQVRPYLPLIAPIISSRDQDLKRAVKDCVDGVKDECQPCSNTGCDYCSIRRTAIGAVEDVARKYGVI